MESNLQQGSYWNGLDWDTSFPTGGTSAIENHIKDNIIHVTQEDRNRWDSGGGGGGTTNYNVLSNKPQINGTTLQNNVSLDTLNIQKKLVSGTDIKTINGNTLLGSGNIEIKTFMGLPVIDGHSWKLNGTISEFLIDFTTTAKPKAGTAYLFGGAKFTDLPISIGTAKGNACEMYMYIPFSDTVSPNIGYTLEITSTNCFIRQGEKVKEVGGKWIGIYQVEHDGYGGPIICKYHMPFQGVMTCPQYTACTIDNEYKYIPVKDSDGASKYYVDQELIKKQDKLIGSGEGQNIKTINGSSIVGSGNTIIQTYTQFPDEFVNDGTLQELVNSIVGYSHAKVGTAYLGQIFGNCTPWGGGQAECKVEYMASGVQVVAVLSVSSGDIAPYFWQLNTYGGAVWRSWVLNN